jgi:hypothetical protein
MPTVDAAELSATRLNAMRAGYLMLGSDWHRSRRRTSWPEPRGVASHRFQQL